MDIFRLIKKTGSRPNQNDCFDGEHQQQGVIVLRCKCYIIILKQHVPFTKRCFQYFNGLINSVDYHNYDTCGKLKLSKLRRSTKLQKVLLYQSILKQGF